MKKKPQPKYVEVGPGGTTRSNERTPRTSWTTDGLEGRIGERRERVEQGSKDVKRSLRRLGAYVRIWSKYHAADLSSNGALHRLLFPSLNSTDYQYRCMYLNVTRKVYTVEKQVYSSSERVSLC